MSSNSSSYFKVGLFVIFSTALLIAAIILFGAGEVFQQRAYLETYVDESVQGVEVGSPVKHRGVPIGNIAEIDFVRNVYPDQLKGDDLYTKGRYVYILVALNPSAFRGVDEYDAPLAIERMVQDGLRLQMVPQGITGIYYLEADYFDPKKNPPMEISWTPEHLYIPSAPSLLTRLGDSVEEVFNRIQSLDIEGILSDAGRFLEVATEALQDASVSEVSLEARGLLAELRQTNARIQEIIGDPSLDSIPQDAADTVASAKRLFNNSEERVAAILEQLERTSGQAAKISATLAAFLGTPQEGSASDLEGTIRNVRLASEDLPETMERLNRTMESIERLTTEQQAALEEIMENLKVLSANLREISENARRYPSQVLFGEPPPRKE
jgi:paraquat-inducible protein B